jgi:predicted TPR repeat methyltransferase
MGPLLREVAARLSGVDLSEKMLAEARRRGLYDELIHGELLASLAPLQAACDLLVAADVLVYLGDLAPLFAAAARALRPAGLLAFTVETIPEAEACGDQDGDEVRLLPSRRYAHSAAYVRRLAGEHKLTEGHLSSTVLRQQGGVDINGYVVVLRKQGEP